MHDFTPIPALIGGILIGLAATLLLLSHGRVAGITGIYGRIFRPRTVDRSFSFAFLGGLVASGIAGRLAMPAAFGTWTAGPVTALVAGLVVGFGTSLGNGCTSGHGVCGLSRLSPRSLVATLTFMATGFATVAVAPHRWGCTVRRHLAAVLAGALFGAGLLVAGMTNPAKIVGFLDAFGRWDASLAFVMVGAIRVHITLRRLVLRRSSPLFDGRFHIPTRRDLDPRLVVGAALFGVGWGLAGYCPGPGIVALASGSPAALLFVVGMTVGIVVEQRLPVPDLGGLRAAESGE